MDEDASYAAQRAWMVEAQIHRRGISDPRVLAALSRVPRHLFVPREMRNLSYADEPLPIGEGQTISQPYIVAYMTQRLSLEGKERVLEVGTGSGYQTAVLAELAREVFTIEIVPGLADRARAHLESLGYDNIRFRVGDGTLGWPEEAPFDGILVTAAPPEIPAALEEQLAPGGRLVLPVGAESQELTLVWKSPRGLRRDRLLPVRFVPLITRRPPEEKPS